MRHNEVKDITAELLTKVGANFEVESQLERLFGEFLALRTSISGDGGCLHISATGIEETDLRSHTSMQE